MTQRNTPNELLSEFHQRLAASPLIMIGLVGHCQAEPMTVRVREGQPNILFMFSAKDNRISAGGKAIGQFVAKGHDFFASLAGSVTKETDEVVFDSLWDKHADAWFPNGKADAQLNRFTIVSAEMWDTDVSLPGRLKMLTGNTIKASESSSHAVVEPTI